MRKPFTVLCLAVAVAASSANGQDKGVGGVPPAQRSHLIDLGEKVETYTAFVLDGRTFTAANAVAQLHSGYDEVLNLRLDTVDLAKVDADPQGLMRGLFGLMQALDTRCAEFYAADVYTPEIANAKRRALRAIRYLREAIMLRTTERAPEKLYEHGKPALATTFDQHHWTVDARYRAGGLAALPRTVILLCMGGSNVSATIARSADEDNTFSHLAVGYRSIAPHTVAGTDYPAGTMFLVESLIETGVIVKPLAEHYKGVDRDVIFVVRDSSKQPAIDAAMDAFFARANGAILAGKPLGYDFSMGANTGVEQAVQGEEAERGASGQGGVLSDPDAYFCAAIGDEIFAKAGLDLYPVRSALNPGPNSRKLFESWGMDPDAPIMAPGDADVSPVLYRVSEAGLVADLEANHLRQATLRQMFHWMDADGYYLRVPWYMKAFTAVAGRLNDTFLDLGKIPSGMDKHILRSFMALDKAAKLYFNALSKANESFRAEYGRSMTPHDMVTHLDLMRDSVKGTRKWFRGPNTKTWFQSLKGAFKRKKPAKSESAEEGPR